MKKPLRELLRRKRLEEKQERDRQVEARTRSIELLLHSLKRGQGGPYWADIDGWSNTVVLYKEDEAVAFYRIEVVERPPGCTCENIFKTTNKCPVHYMPF